MSALGSVPLYPCDPLFPCKGLCYNLRAVERAAKEGCFPVLPGLLAAAHVPALQVDLHGLRILHVLRGLLLM